MLKCPSGSVSIATVMPAMSVDLPDPVEPLTITSPSRGR
jgi:hypothetical protein